MFLKQKRKKLKSEDKSDEKLEVSEDIFSILLRGIKNYSITTVRKIMLLLQIGQGLILT